MKMNLSHVMFAFFAGVCLASCASTSVDTIKGPDGKLNQLITCGDVKDCYAKASDICGKYKIVNSSSDTSGVWGAPNVPVTDVKLLVECEPKAK